MKSPILPLILGELAWGVALSLIFFRIVSVRDEFWGDSYGSGIFRFYGVLSLIFFFAVFSVGIVGAIKFCRVFNFGNAIAYSILFWILSLVLYTVTFSFHSYTLNLRLIPLYMILGGIIFGFHLGLARDSKTKKDAR